MEWSLEQIAQKIDARFTGDGTKTLLGVAPFEIAGDDQVTFADGPKYLKRLDSCKAGAVIVAREVPDAPKNLLIAENPKVAFAKAIGLFHPPPQSLVGVSEKAFIGEGASIGKDVSIAPMVAIGNGAAIGDRVTLYPGTVIGDDVSIGEDTLIYANVVVREGCRIGRRVIINAGTVIGSDGYGFVPGEAGHFKIPQVGIVRIDDDVEIGAGNTIDRATLGETRIHCGVKTDNQVHIAHNVSVGENTLIIAQSGIAGSVTVGKNVIIAGGVSITDHISIGDGAIIGPKAGVAKSVPAGQVVSGIPEMPHRTWLKVSRILPELPELKKKLAAIEKLVKERDDGSAA